MFSVLSVASVLKHPPHNWHTPKYPLNTKALRLVLLNAKYFLPQRSQRTQRKAFMFSVVSVISVLKTPTSQLAHPKIPAKHQSNIDIPS